MNEQQRKAMELALEALKNGIAKPEEYSKAITALKEALAQTDNTAKLYEELRSIIDGGSESFTHEDAVQYLKDRLAEPEQEPVAMRTPKVGDKVVCIEDDSLGMVAYLTAGGSPEIRFDDGSHGTYLLREFAELFRYTTPPQPKEPEQRSVSEHLEPVAWLCERKDGHFDVLTDKTCVKCFPLYTTPPQRKPLTDEQIDEAWSSATGGSIVTDDMHAFARTIYSIKE